MSALKSKYQASNNCYSVLKWKFTFQPNYAMLYYHISLEINQVFVQIQMLEI